MSRTIVSRPVRITFFFVLLLGNTAHSAAIEQAVISIDKPAPGCESPQSMNTVVVSHQFVYAWAKFDTIAKKDTVVFKWYRPDGRLHMSKKTGIQAASRRACWTSRLKLNDSKTRGLQGRWRVVVTANGEVKKRLYFHFLKPLIQVQRGDVPIILTAPHGGGYVPPNVDERPRGTMTNDVRTHRATWAAAKAFLNITGMKPYLVIGRIERPYIDLNREYVHRTPFRASEALADPDAVPYYHAYHHSIRSMIGQIKARWGSGLLIDIHGQSDEPGWILRGTRDGQTLKSPSVRALYMKGGLFAVLKTRGYTVMPSTANAIETMYNGGFTTVEYGQLGPFGFHALQVELGRDFRDIDRVDQTGRDLGEAIAKMYQVHMVKRIDGKKP